jgi:hypothetical protein
MCNLSLIVIYEHVWTPSVSNARQLSVMHDSERTPISVASAWPQPSLWKSRPQPTRQISLMAVAALDNTVGHLTFAEKVSTLC